MNSILMNTMAGPAWDGLFAGVFALLLAAILVYAIAIPQGGKGWWLLTILSGGLVIASFMVGQGQARSLMLDAAALLAVALVWLEGSKDARSAAQTYLVMLVLAIICMEAGTILGGEGGTASAAPMDKVAVALLIAGFGLKLALAPAYFWLPRVAGAAKPMTSALIVSIIDIGAFVELAQLRTEMTWVFDDHRGLWIGIALLTMFVGAILALAQTNIKKMLAYSTMDDMGYLLLGLAAGSAIGISGAIAGAISHAFFKVVLFGAVGAAEYKSGKELTFGCKGMSASYPVTGAAFILGAIGMIGVPPFFGFIGRWRLYLAGIETGGIWLALAMIAATALALLYYVRAIHKVWLGAPVEATKAGESKLAAAVLIVLVVLMLAAGLCPGWLTGMIG